MVTFRKSKKIGPFRFTLSPRGVSTSVGTRSARVSLGPDGKIRRTVSLPGTGIYDTKVVGSTSGKRPGNAAQSSPSIPTQAERTAGEGMTMLDLQHSLNEADAAGFPAAMQPVVEVTMRGKIKQITLPKG